jgi:hypothetical protein
MLYQRIERKGRKLTWAEIDALPGAVVSCIPCSAEGYACDAQGLLRDLPPVQFSYESVVLAPDPEATANAALGAAVRLAVMDDDPAPGAAEEVRSYALYGGNIVVAGSWVGRMLLAIADALDAEKEAAK